MELTETQAKLVLDALEEWFRLRMGQYTSLATDLAFLGFQYDPNQPKRFDLALKKRDEVEAMLKAANDLAFPPNGMPQKVEQEVQAASDMWSALRYALVGKDNYYTKPFRLGTEPLPKIVCKDE